MLTAGPLRPTPAYAEVTRQVSDPISGDRITVNCRTAPFTADYMVEATSGVPLGGPYGVERGADKGLIRLMNEGGRRVRRYIIGRRRLRGVVRLKLGVSDHIDLVFTSARIVLVHSAIADGGIFTTSDVYPLAYRNGGVDSRPLHGNSDLRPLLTLGLAGFDRGSGRCFSEGRR